MRLGQNQVLCLSLCFNPRTRKGCDRTFYEYAEALGVSIHAPVKDATSSFDFKAE